MKLIDVIDQKAIKISLEGNSKEDVIKELIHLLIENEFCNNPEKIFAAVMAREKIMTTGVGRGVAIPHCKWNECNRFAISLGIHASGVDYNAIDKQPAKIIFLLIGPENNPGMHIRLLSRISRLISKDTLRESLLNCATPEEAFELLKNEEEKYFEIAS